MSNSNAPVIKSRWQDGNVITSQMTDVDKLREFARNDILDLLEELDRAESSLDFYRCHVKEFGKLAKALPEPFQTLAFDIIAAIWTSDAHRKWVRSALKDDSQCANLLKYMSEWELAVVKTAVGLEVR